MKVLSNYCLPIRVEFDAVLFDGSPEAVQAVMGIVPSQLHGRMDVTRTVEFDHELDALVVHLDYSDGSWQWHTVRPGDWVVASPRCECLVKVLTEVEFNALYVPVEPTAAVA